MLSLLLLACTSQVEVTRAEAVELVEESHPCAEWHQGDGSTALVYTDADADEHMRYPLDLLACQSEDACYPAAVTAIYRDGSSLVVSVTDGGFPECSSPDPWGTLLVRYWRVVEE